MGLSTPGAVTGITAPVPVAAPGEWRDGELPSGAAAVVATFPSVADQRELHERLYRWRDVLEEVSHPGIVFPVIETGSDGYARLVYPRPYDIGVRNVRTQRGWPLCLEILAQLASILDALHERGLIHGNLGASSVWWMDDSRVQTPDAALGLALEGLVPASLHYAVYLDPAVGNSEMLVPSSDQYSLAVLAYEMISGRQATASQREGVVMVDPVEVNRFAKGAASVPAAVFDILQRTLQGGPHTRFDTCTSFVEALREATDGGKTPQLVASGLRVLETFRSKLKRAAVPLALLLASVVVYTQSQTVRRVIAGAVDRTLAKASLSSSAAPEDTLIPGTEQEEVVAPMTGTIVFSVPRGSVVYLDGVRLNGSPRAASVNAGTHDVNVRLPGAQGTRVRRVHVPPDSTLVVRVP